jgi:hypothetical protein
VALDQLVQFLGVLVTLLIVVERSLAGETLADLGLEPCPVSSEMGGYQHVGPFVVSVAYAEDRPGRPAVHSQSYSARSGAVKAVAPGAGQRPPPGARSAAAAAWLG